MAVHAAYELFRDHSRLAPLTSPHARAEIRGKGAHWTVDRPPDRAEWLVTFTADIPTRLLAWRTVGLQVVPARWEVWLSETVKGNETDVRLFVEWTVRAADGSLTDPVWGSDLADGVDGMVDALLRSGGIDG